MARPAPARTFPPEPLGRAEVVALLDACRVSCPTGRRNRALVCLLWRSGLRISEALELLPRHVDTESGAVRVLRGKGRPGDRRDRVVGIDRSACAEVQAWLEVRTRLALGPSAPLFCTLAGGRIDPSYIRQLLPRLARRAGLGRRVHAHALRHTHAGELVAEGLELRLVQEQLGHRHVATTERYLARIAPERRLAVMLERAGWAD